MAKRKGGNPKNRKGGSGRVTPKSQPPCLKRSSHERRRVPCKHSSRMRVGDGPWVEHCSWCGAKPGCPPNNETKRRAASLDDGGPVPEEMFSPEEPVIALNIPDWQKAHRGVQHWPEEVQRALLDALS